MLRSELNTALKDAVRRRDSETAATLRLILAALKDREIAARTESGGDGIGDDEVLRLLQKMAQQARESAQTYAEAGRDDLVQKERNAEKVIRRFLPRELDSGETEAAVDAVIAEVGATRLTDMGKVMSELRSRYAGRMDFSEASAKAKAKLR
jgi:hypothetical protein